MSHDPHAASGSPTQSTNASAWTEPPWSGFIETTGDALLILEAARRGLIPRVTRRLVDSERKMITSGSVFVFDEDESGIKRWTDGFFWSPSRILGNFLLYRETEKRGAGHRSARIEQISPTEEYGDGKQEGQTLSRPKGETSRLGIDRQRERSLVGSLTNSYKFKPGGMMKKTFSLTIGGVAQHLISYYKIEDVEQGRLRAPSTLPELASLDISPEYLDKTHFRNPPKVEIGVDGVPRYRGEADDIDTSPRLLAASLSGGPYYDGETSGHKRGKRYDPYGTGASKRSRKSKSKEHNDVTLAELPQPLAVSVHQPQPGYPDPSAAGMHYAPYSYYQVPSTYPVPPMYSPGPYPTLPPPAQSSSPAPAPVAHTPSPPQGTTAPAPALTYPAYAQPPPAEQSAAPNPPPPPPVYPSYYPPPHGYAAYPGVAWPHYTGYAPQPQPQSAGADMDSSPVESVSGMHAEVAGEPEDE
ncbi:hypothetical protein OBBRIDRAFT_794205 [Obba rivulosa]|uniref:Gti1/Pac2 family-domain-containing protein n=1 Tax=Obba rivulosa TaxID=1052685 RepID=A0A8E2DL52_9APHY|nr:hypothetical protein OBBRIDRAFT_794205 [Obba rivulosa]